MIRFACDVLEDDERLLGVVKIQVPSIYGHRGRPLPKRMAKLVRPAAEALGRVYLDVVAAGGHLYVSDAYRSPAQQQMAHEDWKTGRKSAFSPPSCNSVHEACRAIDIDAFDTGIGHAKVRAILNRHGWIHIVETLTGSECWHYEYREERWERYKAEHGYAAMARAMKQDIGNTVRLPGAVTAERDNRWLQESLNKVLGTTLVVDGMYGEATRAAVREFQARHGLQVDGVAGPITRSRLGELVVV